MPWKECSVMDERVQFVARRLAGEPMLDLCRAQDDPEARTRLREKVFYDKSIP